MEMRWWLRARIRKKMTRVTEFPALDPNQCYPWHVNDVSTCTPLSGAASDMIQYSRYGAILVSSRAALAFSESPWSNFFFVSVLSNRVTRAIKIAKRHNTYCVLQVSSDPEWWARL
jgi:hypothetical protein